MLASVEPLRKVFRLASVVRRKILPPILTWLPVAPVETKVTVVPLIVMLEPFVGLVVNVTEPAALPQRRRSVAGCWSTAPVSVPNPLMRRPELVMPELLSLRVPPVVPTPR